MKKILFAAMLLAASTAWAGVNGDGDIVRPTSEFGDDEAIGTGIINDFIHSLATPQEEPAEKPSLGYKLNKFASTPVFGAYIIGSYKYSSQDGAEGGPGFNARLIRAYVDGSILTDFKYRIQVEINGTPHIKDYYVEWARYKEFSVKLGQFKRAFTFENPYNPWDVGVGDYSLAVKKMAGFGDKCGEASTGGRDQGLQIQGDLFPVGNDKHRLIHYQAAIYNGNGINQSDNNERKDLIGTIQVQPVKDLFIGVFGWKGNWESEGVTVSRNRYAIGGKYEHNNWSARAEYIHSTGHKVSEYDSSSGTWSGTGKADGFYATVGIPVADWFKVYLKYDQYRDQATEATRHTMYTIAPNFRLHKNLMFQLQCNIHQDKTAADEKYGELWLQTYIRF